jgi:hypothetical protein
MAADTPFTSDASLTYPPDDGKAAVARSNSVSGTFQHEGGGRFVLEGAGTQVVDFGSLSTNGAKSIHIEVAPVAAGGIAAPVLVTINGGVEPWEIAQGGHIEYCNPIPTPAGVLAMSIAHTQDACVVVRILG